MERCCILQLLVDCLGPIWCGCSIYAKKLLRVCTRDAGETREAASELLVCGFVCVGALLLALFGVCFCSLLGTLIPSSLTFEPTGHFSGFAVVEGTPGPEEGDPKGLSRTVLRGSSGEEQQVPSPGG